jgi:ATP-dependent DNA helicase RecG
MSEVHYPSPGTDAAGLESGTSPAHRRLAFEELFFLELYLGLLRRDIARAPAIRCTGEGPLERPRRAP